MERFRSVRKAVQSNDEQDDEQGEVEVTPGPRRREHVRYVFPLVLSSMLRSDDWHG